MEDLSWLSLALLVSLPFLLLIILQSLSRGKIRSSSSTNLPPGPRPLPIIGDLHRLNQNGLPHHSLQKLSIKYGDIMHLKLGRVPALVISSPELAEKITKIHDLDFCTRPQKVAARKLSYNYNDVGLSPYGDLWRQLRKLCTTEVLSSKRVQMVGRIREEEIHKMMGRIAQEVSSTEQSAIVDLSHMSKNLVQEIVYRSVLGKSWDASDNSLRRRIIAPLEEMNFLLAAGVCVADFFPWAWWVDMLSGYKSMVDKCFSHLDHYLDEIVDKRLRDQDGEKKTEDDDFLNLLLRLEKSGSITRDSVKGVILDMFFAGIDTNSTTITWAMAELMRNPKVMVKARQEVRQVFGGKGKVEESDMEKLPYLRAVVKETLRLRPPAPLLLPRESICPTKIDGYNIPAKTLVMINVYSISRDPRYWERPLEFMPERFLGSTIDYKGQHFEYLPFGAGRRICPGMQFAMAIVELALANLLYAFDWELPAGMGGDDLDMSEKNGANVTKKTPLLVVANPVQIVSL